MVKIYNPNVVGKQVLIDVKNIDNDKLRSIEDIKPFMDQVVEELNLNIVGECPHQFVKRQFTLWCYNDIFIIRKSFIYPYFCR